jgi:hypothetical protein
LGDLPSVSSYTVAGSVIAWGGYVRDSAGNSLWDDRIQELVKNALWQTGGFSWVDAGRIGGFLNHYISIKVTTKVDFAKLSDVFDVIQGAIYQVGFRPEVQNFWVESVPASAASNPDVAQPGTGGGTNTPGSQPTNTGGGFPSISLPSLPNIFGSSPGQSASNPIDKLASWLGIGATEAAVIGAVAVVAGILIVKKAL